MRSVILLSLTVISLSGCSFFSWLNPWDQEYEDLKSPCVGTDDSPCGPHRPVNEWWMKKKEA